MTNVAIDRLVLDVPGLGAAEAHRLADSVGLLLAARVPAGIADLGFVLVTLDPIGPVLDLDQAARRIVDAVLRQATPASPPPEA